jgi:HAD superfamily hydrolase (TIGR01490 family)
LALAIFDLDNTLLAGDSDVAWGQYLVRNHIVDGDAYERENQRFYDAYKDGTLDIMEFLAFALQPLAMLEPDRLQELHRDFMVSDILPMITDEARALVSKHRSLGDELMIITATNRFITAPIATEFGIDALLATEPEQKNGRFTGKVSGTPCFQDGKVLRLNEWLRENNSTLNGSWFYSDSHNDLPLLNKVEHPVAVNPDETLKSHAEKLGWPIIQLHDNI